MKQVTFSESFLNFIRTECEKGSKVAKLINAARQQSGYLYDNKILTTDEVDFITMRADGLLSYLPAGKDHKVNDRGEWSRDGRQAGKPAKVIRKVFNPKLLRFIAPQAFEIFGNAYKSTFLDNGFKFELMPAQRIGEVYDMNRAEGGSSLHQSCMAEKGRFHAMYHNCKDVQILVLTNNKKQLCGRALIWNVTKNDQAITFMDRIYVAQDYMYDLFLNYAKEQMWWRKASYNNRERRFDWVNPETDATVYMNVTISLDTEYEKYPYIDTFHYGGDGWISNSDADSDYVYNGLKGAREGDSSSREEDEEDNHDEESYDDLSGEWISNDDACYLSGYSSNRRHREVYTHINGCVMAYVDARGNEEWFLEDDSNVCQIGRDYYYTGHPEVRCLADGDYALVDNCVYCETDGEYYDCDDSDMIQTNDGEYRHKHNDDDVVYIEDRDGDSQGTYHYLPDVEDETIVIENGERHWKDATCIKQVELHKGATCGKVWALKIDLLKWRNKIYHKSDVRIENKITRIAYPTI